LLKLPDGTVKVLVEGQARVSVTQYLENDSFFEASAEYLTEVPGDATTIEALIRTVGTEFERYAKVKKNVPEEALASVVETDDPATLADLVSGHLGIEVHPKQDLLETLSVSERLEKVYGLMQGELSVLQVEKKDQDARQIANGADAARILSERTDEGDPARAGRRRGR